jgi:agmatine deiminase
VESAARRGARIICLPELFRSRYFPQARRASAARFAEPIPGESTAVFSRLALELQVVIIVPLFERAQDDKHYNSAVVIDADGRLLETYRKIHIPHDPLFYEKSHFAPGNLGFRVYRTRYADFSVLICYDQWFPEAARACSLQGAEIIFYPTAIGDIQGHTPPEGDWRESWITMHRAHAIANSVHVAAVNRVGREGKLNFWGTSFACDSFGNILKAAGRNREEILVVKADLSLNRRLRKGWGFMRNRRPDSYRALIGAA